jgi:hypothetical protein
MDSAASAVRTLFLMLPSQNLLNSLLYDTSQLAIPSDRVDKVQVHAGERHRIHRRAARFSQPGRIPPATPHA